MSKLENLNDDLYSKQKQQVKPLRKEVHING